VSSKELEANTLAAEADAVAAYYTATNTTNFNDYLAFDIAASALEVASAAKTADWSPYVSVQRLTKVKEYLAKYFELTEENRKYYEMQAEYLNLLGANNA